MIWIDKNQQLNIDTDLTTTSLSLNGRKNVINLVLNKYRYLSNAWKIWICKNLGVTINYSCQIANNAVINLGVSNSKKGRVVIGSKTQISQGVILDCWGGQITLDKNVFVGPYTVIYGHGGVNIGRDSLIAMHCRIIAANHTIPTCNILIRSQPNIPLPITIGKDVWLGAGVTILGGVTVGDGCVVGAGAVVTKDLPPYSIAVGTPARVIKKRLENKEGIINCENFRPAL